MNKNTTENNDLSENQQHVIHLRRLLSKSQLDGVDPPEWLLDELKIAERLVRIDSRENEK
jgi:hypothetical protein